MIFESGKHPICWGANSPYPYDGAEVGYPSSADPSPHHGHATDVAGGSNFDDDFDSPNSSSTSDPLSSQSVLSSGRALRASASLIYTRWSPKFLHPAITTERGKNNGNPLSLLKTQLHIATISLTMWNKSSVISSTI